MAQIKFTVSDVLQKISDLKGESSTNTDSIRIRAVSTAYRDFAKRGFYSFHLVRNATVSTDGTNNTFTIGSATYPMRFKGLSEVFVGTGTTESERYTVVDYHQFKKTINDDSTEQVAYEYYDYTSDEWKVKVNPTPATSLTVTYSYFYEPPTLTLTTDTVICPNPKVIALLALGDIYYGEEEISKANQVKQEAEQLISEIDALETAPAVGQLYGMSNGGAGGVGTY